MNAEDQTFYEIFHASQSYGAWCNEVKARALYDLIRQSQDPKIVEIGVFMGQSAFVMMESLKRYSLPGSFFAIDPWTTEAALEGNNTNENDEWWASIDINQIYEGFLECVATNGFGHICNVLRQKSDNVFYEWKDMPIDILHIDGNHSEYNSVRDVCLWSTAVAPNGFVIMDDTDWETTRKATDMLDVLFTRIDNPAYAANNFLMFKNDQPSSDLLHNTAPDPL